MHSGSYSREWTVLCDLTSLVLTNESFSIDLATLGRVGTQMDDGCLACTFLHLP